MYLLQKHRSISTLKGSQYSTQQEIKTKNLITNSMGGKDKINGLSFVTAKYLKQEVFVVLS